MQVSAVVWQSLDHFNKASNREGLLSTTKRASIYAFKQQ